MDVETKKLVQIDCAWKGTPPFAKQDFNYHHKLVVETRTDMKPLNILQPEGPSFSVSAFLLPVHFYVAYMLSCCKGRYCHDGCITSVQCPWSC